MLLQKLHYKEGSLRQTAQGRKESEKVQQRRKRLTDDHCMRHKEELVLVTRYSGNQQNEEVGKGEK